MSKEQLFFIQVLSDYLNGKKTQRVPDLDWDTILLYARRHQVSGIFYIQAKENMPIEKQDIFRKEMLATVYYQTNRENELKDLKHIFDDANIQFFIVKGPVVAELYPMCQIRTMGDIDLVVHSNDRKLCNDILVSEGYQCRSNQEDREWQYYKNNMELELHDHLVYREAINEPGQDIFFNDCWIYVNEGKLDWNFHLLFLIFHLRKHLMNSGAGFRHFMDLAVVPQKIDIDWKWLEEKLNETGMLAFSKRCYGLIYRWFSIKVPLMDDIDNEFCETATSKIFADGIFGFHNEDNKNSAVFNQVRKKKYPLITMFLLSVKEVFPARKRLLKTEAYAYLERFPFLLPIAWIHRFFRTIKGNKMKIGKQSVEKSFISKDTIEKRDKMLKRWHL